jgi:hypothetical protein
MDVPDAEILTDGHLGMHLLVMINPSYQFVNAFVEYVEKKIIKPLY